jgi:3-phosphoshikimate 1-carboxyvinyltransferase
MIEISEVTYPDQLEIIPLSKPPSASIRVPGSKSITNRALVLGALSAKGFAYVLRRALRSDDTEVMIKALRTLGFCVLTDWPQSLICISSGADEPTIPAAQAELFVGNSGTTMRFLTALVSLGKGKYLLDGVPRMRERPIQDLLDALQQLGVNAYSAQNNGCPPVIVEANGLAGGPVRVKGDVSSQFLSGLLLAAPYAEERLIIEVDGPLVSVPYVQMSLHMLRQWRFTFVDEICPFRVEMISRRSRNRDESNRRTAKSLALYHRLDPRQAGFREYAIEPDASAASYFFAAAAITGGKVSVPHLPFEGLQGDVRFVDVLEDMGCVVERGEKAITVTGATLEGIDVDMKDISDTVMTLAAVACFAEGPTTIRNVAHIRHKETDRLAALANELRKVGADVVEFTDGLTITPRPLRGALIDTYNDHRMAMSMALVGLKVPGIVIKDPGCVAKTYPGFWADLERLRTENREQRTE